MTSLAIDLEPIKDTHSHANNTDEQTVATLDPTGSVIVWSIWFDMTNLTKAATVRLKHKIDNTNYRTFQVANWGLNLPDGFLLSGALALDDDMQVTLQSTEAEGDTRDVVYKIMVQALRAGMTSKTYTVTDGEATPIPDVDVWVTTDIAGTHVIASGKTDALGEVTFWLDSGTVYVWRQKSGYNFDNPDEEAVP